MKTSVIFLFILGLGGVFTASIQTSNEPGTESISSGTDLNEETDKGTSEQNTIKSIETIETTTITADEDTGNHNNGQLDILIEQTYSPDTDYVPQSDIYLDDIPEVPISNDNFYPNPLFNKIQDEIMETAEGFLPVPIFRKRQQARRRYASRRFFRRNPYPYRRPFYFYPYYGFYRPSSLRYY